jgi:hypothetical protein
MRKISVPFLVGFAIVSSAGTAGGQSSDAAAAMSNSVGAQITSMDGMRSQLKLGETKSANPFAVAASALTEAPSGSGTGVDIPIANAKIGGGTSFNLPANALTDASKDSSANMANALQAATPAASGAESLTTTVMLGTGMSQDFSNAVGDQVRSSQRLGK